MDTQNDISSYIIIAGHGRSGSNRLLDVLDCHRRTYCRNEPNELSGSPFNELPSGFFPVEGGDELFSSAWGKAISEARYEMGERDRIGARHKAYINRMAPSGAAVLARRRLRRIALRLRDETWPVPSWYAPNARLRQAVPVFKILLRQGWIISAFERAPGMRVIHNIRNPHAFLRSWRRRYAEAIGPERVFQDNLVDIDKILEHFGESAGRFHAFSEEALIESELWRWRYVNETMFKALNGSARYTIATYEAHDRDSVTEARRLCAFCGLEMDNDMKERAKSLKNTLFADKPAALSEDGSLLAETVERVTEGSPLIDLWAEARIA